MIDLYTYIVKNRYIAIYSDLPGPVYRWVELMISVTDRSKQFKKNKVIKVIISTRYNPQNTQSYVEE